MNKIIKIGNYMPSNYDASIIVDINGIASTVKENHGTVTAILVTMKVVHKMNKNDTNRCIQVYTLTGGKWDKMHDIGKRVYSINGICPTLHTCGGGNIEPKIVLPIKNKQLK